MNVFNEAGRGRKQCSDCKKFIGVRCNTCVCGSSNFAKTAKVDLAAAKEVRTFEEAGRGRKQCAECNAYVGCKVSICVCGHEFQATINEPVVLVYDEPGRKRKQCSDCKKYVGYSVSVCACGNPFEGDENETTEVLVYDEPGRRRKQCENCEKYVGYSVGVCACGAKFNVETDAKNPFVAVNAGSVRSSEKGKMLGFRTSVATPAGDCPYRLSDLQFETMKAWAEKTRQRFGETNKAFLTLNALQYWIRYGTHDVDFSDAKKIEEAITILEEVYPDEAA